MSEPAPATPEPGREPARGRIALFSIRSWLAATLVLVSLLTAGTIALYVIPAADQQVRSLARDAALGQAARAAHDVSLARSPQAVDDALSRASRSGQLSLWLVDDQRHVVAASAFPSIQLERLPNATRAITVALSGRRFVPGADSSPTSVVALPSLRSSGVRQALVAYAPRTAFAARTSDVLRGKLVRGALLAVALAVIVSLGLATLVRRRVRRLARAAREIAGGDFGSPVRDAFPDEIGRLAGSIDEMRERLASAFAVLEHERGGLSRVINRLEEGVIALDPSGIVEVVNPAASELLGIPIERGKRLAHPWPSAVLGVQLERSDEARTVELEAPGGRLLHVQRAALRLGEHHGASLIVLSDRTEAHHREASERRFMANASHELRTPLAAILAAVEMLQSGAKEDAHARDAFLADVQHESRRLQRLTERLLTIARMGTGVLQQAPRSVAIVSRLTYVAELMEPLARASEVTLSVEGDGSARVDPDVLDQVLVGLVGNALKHTPAGGRVRLIARDRGQTISVSVRDTGCGIAPEDLPHVFDRFWRGDAARKSGGFGLGLGIAREHVEAMDGTIVIGSEPGRGTTVDLVLPASSRALALAEDR